MPGYLNESVAKTLARRGLMSSVRGRSLAGLISVRRLPSDDTATIWKKVAAPRHVSKEAALLEMARRITPSREELRRIRANLPKLTFNYDGDPS